MHIIAVDAEQNLDSLNLEEKPLLCEFKQADNKAIFIKGCRVSADTVFRDCKKLSSGAEHKAWHIM